MLALAAAVVVHVFCAPPSPERVAKAVAEVYADEDVQRDLPGERVRAERTPPRVERPPKARDWDEPEYAIPGAVGAVASVLLWSLLGVGAAVLVALIVKAIASGAIVARAARAKAGASVVVPSRADERPPPPIDEADRLAAEGRFDEAVHLLLLRAVYAVRLGARDVPRHFTSREVAGDLALDAARRDPLGVLVEAVERSLFGGRSLGAADWAAARAASDRFHATAPQPVSATAS